MQPPKPKRKPMHTLLEKAFKEALQLDEKDQDAFGAFMLAELKHEKKWDDIYKRSKGPLSSMAKEALLEYKEGKTDELDPNNL